MHDSIKRLFFVNGYESSLWNAAEECEQKKTLTEMFIKTAHKKAKKNIHYENDECPFSEEWSTLSHFLFLYDLQSRPKVLPHLRNFHECVRE